MPVTVEQVSAALELKPDGQRLTAAATEEQRQLIAGLSEQDHAQDTDTPLGELLSANPDGQLLVGARVAEQRTGPIPDTGSIFIGSGAGTYYFYLALSRFERDLTVYTNNMLVAGAYARNRSAIGKLEVLGTGEVNTSYGNVVVKESMPEGGSGLKEIVAQCDFSIVCPTFIDSEHGPSNLTSATRNAHRIILENTRGKVILLSDHKKLSHAVSETDVQYHYSKSEWAATLGEYKEKLELYTTIHPGVDPKEPMQSRILKGEKEIGVENSYRTYCRNSFELHSALGENFVEVLSE